MKAEPPTANGDLSSKRKKVPAEGEGEGMVAGARVEAPEANAPMALLHPYLGPPEPRDADLAR
jgi:hypothetical protein